MHAINIGNTPNRNLSIHLHISIKDFECQCIVVFLCKKKRRENKKHKPFNSIQLRITTIIINNMISHWRNSFLYSNINKHPLKVQKKRRREKERVFSVCLYMNAPLLFTAFYLYKSFVYKLNTMKFIFVNSVYTFCVCIPFWWNYFSMQVSMFITVKNCGLTILL